MMENNGLLLERKPEKNKIVEDVLWIHVFQDEIGACVLPLRQVEKSYDLLIICFTEEQLKGFILKAKIENLKVKITFQELYVNKLFDYIIPKFVKMMELVDRGINTFNGDLI